MPRWTFEFPFGTQGLSQIRKRVLLADTNPTCVVQTSPEYQRLPPTAPLTAWATGLGSLLELQSYTAACLTLGVGPSLVGRDPMSGGSRTSWSSHLGSCGPDSGKMPLHVLSFQGRLFTFCFKFGAFAPHSALTLLPEGATAAAQQGQLGFQERHAMTSQRRPLLPDEVTSAPYHHFRRNDLISGEP